MFAILCSTVIRCYLNFLAFPFHWKPVTRHFNCPPCCVDSKKTGCLFILSFPLENFWVENLPADPGSNPLSGQGPVPCLLLQGCGSRLCQGSSFSALNSLGSLIQLAWKSSMRTYHLCLNVVKAHMGLKDPISFNC